MLEAKIVHHLERMAGFARELGFDGPAMISVHFEGMENVMLMRPGRGGRPIRNREIAFPPVLLPDLRLPVAALL